MTVTKKRTRRKPGRPKGRVFTEPPVYLGIGTMRICGFLDAQARHYGIGVPEVVRRLLDDIMAGSESWVWKPYKVAYHGRRLQCRLTRRQHLFLNEEGARNVPARFLRIIDKFLDDRGGALNGYKVS